MRLQDHSEFALGSAMSAFQSILQIIESNAYDDMPSFPSPSGRPGFLSRSEESAVDFEQVVDMTKIYVSGAMSHIQELRTHASNSQDEIEALTAGISSLQDQLVAARMGTDVPKISFKSFAVGDVALFCPTRAGSDTYVAFNSACPCRYLSSESLSSFRERGRSNATRNIDVYVLGRIVFIQSLVASNSNPPVTNPFNLSPGTEFHLIDVEALPSLSASAGSNNGSQSFI